MNPPSWTFCFPLLLGWDDFNINTLDPTSYRRE
jgi:hypothetical protein